MSVRTGLPPPPLAKGFKTPGQGRCHPREGRNPARLAAREPTNGRYPAGRWQKKPRLWEYARSCRLSIAFFDEGASKHQVGACILPQALAIPSARRCSFPQTGDILPAAAEKAPFAVLYAFFRYGRWRFSQKGCALKGIEAFPGVWRVLHTGCCGIYQVFNKLSEISVKQGFNLLFETRRYGQKSQGDTGYC